MILTPLIPYLYIQTLLMLLFEVFGGTTGWVLSKTLLI